MISTELQEPLAFKPYTKILSERDLTPKQKSWDVNSAVIQLFWSDYNTTSSWVFHILPLLYLAKCHYGVVWLRHARLRMKHAKDEEF